MYAEHAFGILKEVWRILKNPMANVYLQNILSFIIACSILHNIVRNRNNTIDKVSVIWNHQNERYTAINDCTAPEDEAEKMQFEITKHMYIF